MLKIGRADIFQFQSEEAYLTVLLFVVDGQIAAPGGKEAWSGFHF